MSKKNHWQVTTETKDDLIVVSDGDVVIDCGANIGDINVLKIEGEGAEPEILRGAEKTLQRVKYVCVDCGPERGMAKDSTLPPVCHYLLSQGFKFDQVSAKRLTARFVRG